MTERDVHMRLSNTLGEYATLAVVRLSDGYAVAAIGSRATALDAPQEDYLFARIDAASSWIEQMLGARGWTAH